MSPSPSRKTPNMWVLASVTYGAVIAVTALSVLGYFYLSPKRTDSPSGDEARAVTVGSVWIPLYPGATLEATGSTKQGSVTESTLNFQARDEADRVLAFYQAALKKGVFRFATVVKKDDGGTVRSIVHDGKTTVLVTIHRSAEGTQGEIRTVDRDAGNKDARN